MAQSRRDSSSVRRRSWATFIIPDRRSGLEQASMITERLTFMFFALGSSEISVRYFCAIWNLHFYKLTHSRCWRQPKCPGAGPKVSSNGGALRRDWHRAFTRDREKKKTLQVASSLLERRKRKRVRLGVIACRLPRQRGPLCKRLTKDWMSLFLSLWVVGVWPRIGGDNSRVEA